MKNLIITLILIIAAHVAAQQVPVHQWTGEIKPDSSIKWDIHYQQTLEAASSVPGTEITVYTRTNETDTIIATRNPGDSIDAYFSYKQFGEFLRQESERAAKMGLKDWEYPVDCLVPLTLNGHQVEYLITDPLPIAPHPMERFAECETCDYIYIGRYHKGDHIVITAGATTIQQMLNNTDRVVQFLYGTDAVIEGHKKLNKTPFGQ
jgi:hypothetical protein